MKNPIKNFMHARKVAVIEQIHADFDSAQERLLSEAKKILASINVPEEPGIKGVADKLVRLGFTNAKQVAEYKKTNEKREDVLKQKAVTVQDADFIHHYQHHYPFLKFLTEAELDRICAKWNLIHAPVANYTEAIPVKNILDIERAQPLLNCDMADTLIKLSANEFSSERVAKFNRLMIDLGHPNGVFTQTEIRNLCIKYHGHDVPAWTTNAANNVWLRLAARNLAAPRDHRSIYSISYEAEVTHREGLFIAAPKSHFNLEGLSKQGKHGFKQIFKITPKDPIVFRYVRGGIQVLTKWGLEASDPLLTNSIDN